VIGSSALFGTDRSNVGDVFHEPRKWTWRHELVWRLSAAWRALRHGWETLK